MGKNRGQKKALFLLVTFMVIFLVLSFYSNNPIRIESKEKYQSKEIPQIQGSINSQDLEELIYITKAIHLNKNKKQIEDLTSKVDNQDRIWSSKIANGEYIQVTFEKPLDKSRDITIYARSSDGNPARVEVYSGGNQNTFLGEFENVLEEKKYVLGLGNLNEEVQETFDLKIFGSVQFDFIVDPRTVNKSAVTNSIQEYDNIAGKINPAYALIYFQQNNGLDDLPDQLWFTPEIVNKSSVFFERYASGSPISSKYTWRILESPNLTVQRGKELVADQDSEVNIEINPINLTEAFVIVYGRCNSSIGVSYHLDGFFSGNLTNSTNLLLRRGQSDCNATVTWQVIEYRGATVQSGETTFTNNDIILTEDLSQINLSETFLIFNRHSPGPSSGMDTNMFAGNFTNSTQIRFERYTNSTNTLRIIDWYVVSIPGLSVQYGSISTNVTNVSLVNIAPINDSRSFVINSHYDDGTGGLYKNQASITKVYNSTHLSIEKANQNGETTTIFWQVIEFPDDSDVHGPKMYFKNPTAANASNFSNLSPGHIEVNLSSFDYTNISTITIKVFNASSGALVNSSTNSSINSTSAYIFMNFTGLTNGTYYFNATANDTLGYTSFTETRQITIGNTSSPGDGGGGEEDPGGGGGGGGGGGSCTGEWQCTIWSVCLNGLQARTCSLLPLGCSSTYQKPLEEQECGVSKSPLLEDITEEISLVLDKNTVAFSNQLIAFVGMQNLKDSAFPLEFKFKIRDTRGRVVYTYNEIVNDKSEEIYKKEFSDLNIGDGRYTLVLQIVKREYVEELRQTFTVGEELYFGLNKNQLLIVGASVFGLILLIVLFKFIKNNRKRRVENKIKKLKKKDNKIQKKIKT